MSTESKIPTEIEILAKNPLKKRNMKIYYNDVIRNYNVTNDKETNFEDLPINDQIYIKKFCLKQFDKEIQYPWFYLCIKSKKERIVHKNINPQIFDILNIIENRILYSLKTKTNLNELSYLFRKDDKGMEISDTDYSSYNLSKLCTFVKKYIMVCLDGLFSNLVSSKLIDAYTKNKRNYEVLLSYVPYILSSDELRLLKKLLNLFTLIDHNKDITNMTMSGLLRLFSLVLFDSSCFTNLDMLLKVEDILIDISKLSFQKIPKTVIKRILKCV